MKTLVAYMSQTGNTKKVAEAIYGVISGEKEIKVLKEIDSLDACELAFIGFPIQAFGPAEDAKKFIKQYADGKKIALFMTHAAPEDNEEVQVWLDACRQTASAAEVVGMFDCQGELAPDIMEFLKQSDDPKMRAFGELGPTTKGQPDEGRLEKARDFAKGILQKIG